MDSRDCCKSIIPFLNYETGTSVRVISTRLFAQDEFDSGHTAPYALYHQSG
jgi:hypothetical protein